MQNVQNDEKLYAGVIAFWAFLNAPMPEILKCIKLGVKALNKLPRNYYFEILVLKYLKIPGTQTLLVRCYFCLNFSFVSEKRKGR